MASYRAVAMQLEEQKRIANEWSVKANDWLNRSTLDGAHAARQAQAKLSDANYRADFAEEMVRALQNNMLAVSGASAALQLVVEERYKNLEEILRHYHSCVLQVEARAARL